MLYKKVRIFLGSINLSETRESEFGAIYKEVAMTANFNLFPERSINLSPFIITKTFTLNYICGNCFVIFVQWLKLNSMCIFWMTDHLEVQIIT